MIDQPVPLGNIIVAVVWMNEWLGFDIAMNVQMINRSFAWRWRW